MTLASQEQAGLDIICDGEQRRRHYIWGFIEHLGSVDFENPAKKQSRGQRYSEETPAPRVLDEWTWTKPILLDALRFAKARTDRQVKVTLPLITDSSIDQISIECAASGVDLSVLDCLAGKDVMVGVIDVGTEEVESAQVVADRIRHAMKHVSAEHLIACTDCGMVPNSRIIR